MKSKALFSLVAFSALIAGAVIFFSHPDFTWHDQQRLGQISISVLVFASLLLPPSRGVIYINSVWLWAAVGVLVIGALSASLALRLLWAATEVAVLVASIGISAFVFRLMRQFGDRADLVLGGILRLLLAGMVFQFYVSCISALAHADLFFSPLSLIYGFSNERFEGQFLTLVVPLLGASLFLPTDSNLRYPRWFDMFLMVSLAGMVFVVGTRGTIAGWLTACILFWGFKGGGRNTAKCMFVVMALGFALAWLVLQTITSVTGQSIDLRLDSRFASLQVFGLSSRDILWKLALTKIEEFPWLGVGPMHFASLGSPIAAHPHQSLLQIASEWGLPVFFMIMATVTVWLIKVFAEVRSGDAKAGSDLRWALLFAVLASMVQSMVDGVLVMPYTQLWLAIVVGWCSARCLPVFQGERTRVPGWLPLVLWGAANVLLVAVVVMSYPSLVGAPEYCGGGPRFWCNGRI